MMIKRVNVYEIVFMIWFIIPLHFSVIVHGQPVNNTFNLPNSYTSISSQLNLIEDTFYLNTSRWDIESNLILRGFSKLSGEGEVYFSKDFGVPMRDLYLGYRTMLYQNGHLFFASSSQDTQSVVRSHLFKCTMVGDTVWTREYSSTTDFLAAYSLIAHPEGGFVLLGTVKEELTNESDIFILRTDTAGNELWRKTYGVANRWDEAIWVIPLPNEEFIVGGYFGIYPPNYPNDNLYFNGFITKFKNNNTTQTIERGRPLQTEGAASFCLPISNGTYILSSSISNDTPNSSYNKGSIFWMDENLNIIQEKLVDSIFKSGGGLGIIVQIGQDFVLTGGWKEDTYRTTLTKINQHGNIIWERKYHFTQEFDGHNILADFIALPNNSGFAAAGQVVDSQGQSIWFLRIDEYGCLVPNCHLADIENVYSQNLQVSIFPNPVSEMLYVFNPFQLQLKTSLIDFTGKAINNNMVIEAQSTLIFPVSELTSGIYFLQITLPDGKTVTEKIIKQ